MSLGTAGLYSIMGLCVVFAALVFLMIIIKIVTKIIPAEDGIKKEPQGKAMNEEKSPDAVLASGSAGEIKLNGVDPKIAAMCMAITADKMNKPINELRFISIKEIEE